MVDINGTSGADTIDVTDDEGTLNGNPQGTPVGTIRARGGDDTISVTNSTITGDVLGRNGNDDIAITNSTITGRVNAGAASDTVEIHGSDIGDISLGSGSDELTISNTTLSGTVRGGGGSDTLNLPEGTVVDDLVFGSFVVTQGVGYSLSNGTFTLPGGSPVTYQSFNDGTGFMCFASDTLIDTPNGSVAIQKLKVGDFVLTSGNKPRKIRWIGSRSIGPAELAINSNLRPVRIVAGALGQGLPTRDLLVSRQHRMLVNSKVANRMFGQSEVLLPAIKLVSIPGIFIDYMVGTVEYFHMLFDRHEIIFAEGAPTESLFTGEEAIRSLSPEAREEILTILPEVAELDYEPQSARYIPSPQKQVRLVRRHLKNSKPLLRECV